MYEEGFGSGSVLVEYLFVVRCWCVLCVVVNAKQDQVVDSTTHRDRLCTATSQSHSLLHEATHHTRTTHTHVRAFKRTDSFHLLPMMMMMMMMVVDDDDGC
jgi:hypothetical protein